MEENKLPKVVTMGALHDLKVDSNVPEEIVIPVLTAPLEYITTRYAQKKVDERFYSKVNIGNLPEPKELTQEEFEAGEPGIILVPYVLAPYVRKIEGDEKTNEE